MTYTVYIVIWHLDPWNPRSLHQNLRGLLDALGTAASAFDDDGGGDHRVPPAMAKEVPQLCNGDEKNGEMTRNMGISPRKMVKTMDLTKKNGEHGETRKTNGEHCEFN